MNARETILERLRHARSDNPVEMPGTPADADLFADMPDLERLIENFGQRLADLAGQFYTDFTPCFYCLAPLRYFKIL